MATANTNQRNLMLYMIKLGSEMYPCEPRGLMGFSSERSDIL